MTRKWPWTLVTSLALVTAAGLAAGCRGPERTGPAPAAVQAGPPEPPGPPAPEVQAVVQGLLEAGRHPALSWPELGGLLPGLKTLYAAEPDGLFWFAGEWPHPALAGALQGLREAAAHGLDPADYDAALLDREWQALSTSPAPSLTGRARFDVALSAAALRFLSAVHAGRVDPRLVGFDYDVSAKRRDLAAALRFGRDLGGLPEAVAATEPQFAGYGRLVKALAHQRALAAAGEPAPLPALADRKKKLEPGQAWAGVAALAARLRALGDLAPDAPPPATSADGTPLYSGAVVAAVKRFQGRHTLEPDGVLGRGTLAALAVPAAARARQIELALERTRWLSELRPEPLVFVNLAVFRLWAFDPAQRDEPLLMKVVVGKSVTHATPIFVAHMEYVIFRPYWNPPPSIVRDEIVPQARRDPSYLAREEMEIVSGGEEDDAALPASPENLDRLVAGELFVRQRPGEKNALGLAKFIFPNAENVYMHGTPTPSLFARARRDLSHGCIRLEDPVGLAEWVLRGNPGWTRARIEAAMRGPRPTQVNLKRKLAVLLFYDTAYVDAQGVVYFADDYYGHDARLGRALSQGYPYARQR